jgi:lysophospholipase L1-like esterase
VQAERELREIIGRLPAGSVIATLPAGLGRTRVDALNLVVRSAASEAGLRVADVFAHTGPPWDGKFAEDRFHPGLLGYADWAAAFADALGLTRPRPRPAADDTQT